MYFLVKLLTSSYVHRLNRDVLPACLSNAKDFHEKSAEAMGWGSTLYAGSGSEELLKGFLSLVENSECNESYNEEFDDLPNGIASTQICAVDPTKQQDTW